jgi:hypothetical protein
MLIVRAVLQPVPKYSPLHLNPFLKLEVQQKILNVNRGRKNDSGVKSSQSRFF